MVPQGPQNLQEQNKMLLELQEFKRNMTSMIVHDLRNPLSLILLSNQQESYQNKVVDRAGRRMMRMIENILDFYQSEEPAVKLYKKKTAVCDLFTNSIQQMESAIKSKGMKVEWQACQDLFVEVDEGLMIRVMENLLSNAIKFSPANASINLQAEIQGKNILLQISDNGLGIPDALKQCIFKPFESHDPDASSNQSFGLGLGFVKMIIDHHEGTIQVKDNPAGGSIFQIQLPAYEIPANNCKPNDFVFSEAERLLLDPCIADLAQLEIYQISAIQKRLRQLPDAPQIIRWKKRLLDHCYHSNATCYQQLLEVLS